MERFLRIFWLLLIPTQLGKHFWLNESSVLGIRVDYLSLIFYLTDIVWCLWVLNKRKEIRKKIINKKTLSWENLALVLLAVINILVAGARWVAIYRWIRIGQWWLSWKLVSFDKKKFIEDLKRIVPIWILVEVFLGLAQVVKGGSLNGIWWWLGERRFTYGGIGIAQMRILDEGWIRAYGSFSHPNSLAGFLLLAWWWYRRNMRKNRGIFYWIVNWSAVLGIALTGSRTVWLLAAVMLLGEQVKKWKEQSKKEIWGKLFLTGGVICLILGLISVNYRVSDFVGGWDVDSLQKRELLAVTALKTIKNNPLFGVGAGNFVAKIPEYRVGNFYWMQPVHNIILLIWSEIGTLGLILMIVLGRKYILKIWQIKYWWMWVIVGVTGMLDHYWLTLPQNSWLLAIILGVI